MGFDASSVPGQPRPKPVSQYLLERMRAAGAREAFFVLRPGKWDIPAFFGSGARLDMDICYLVTEDERGPPFSIDQAYRFLGDAVVLFGFPDILVQPDVAYSAALERLRTTGADVVVGLFPAMECDRNDACHADTGGRVIRLETASLAQSSSAQLQVWVTAVWRPTFSEFLHATVATWRTRDAADTAGRPLERPVGAAIDAAIDAGMHVNSVFFERGRYLDIGDPLRLPLATSFPGVWSGMESSPEAPARGVP